MFRNAITISALVAAAAFCETPAPLGKAYRDSPTPARRKALESFAAVHKDVNGALADLTLGVVAFEQKQYADAIHRLQAAQPRLAQLADYTGYYLAAARLASDGDAKTASLDAASIRGVPLRSLFAARSFALQARGMAASGKGAEAAGLLREHYSELPQPDGDLALAVAYQVASDFPHAAEYYQRVYYQYPSSDQATQAAAALVTLRESMGSSYPAASPKAMVDRADQLLAQREYQRARSEFQSLIPQLSGAPRDRARVGVGGADYQNGNVAAAYSYLRTLVVSDPEADAERLYYLAECARKLNDDDQMMEAIHKLGQHHAQSLWRYKALLAVSNRFLVTNQPDKYVSLCKAVYENFADQPQAVACHWRVAWTAYIRRKHDARELMQQHLASYPAHPTATAALYFLGRLSETTGDFEAARSYYTKLSAYFPNYYYAILARERMAQPKLVAAELSPKTAEFLSTIAFAPHRPAVPSQADVETARRIARARLLIGAGLQDLGQNELRFGGRNGGQPYLLAMELARTANTPHEQLHNLKSAAPDYLSLTLEDAPQAFWQFLFPLPFRQDLERNAKDQGLDPFMVAALIRQESEFNPQALSPKHAYGLTQVEPSTGRALARRVGVKRFTNRSLFQPALNLKLGTYYLRALLDQWGGKWEETLASYNAGKSRVNDWITWNQYQEPAEFVESIPFTETREYVQAVMRNAAVYRQLYGGKGAKRVQAAALQRPGRATRAPL